MKKFKILIPVFNDWESLIKLLDEIIKVENIDVFFVAPNDLAQSMGIANSKTKDKTDLGQTHLVKAYLDMAKWKSERLNPKVYQKKDNLQLTGIDNSPIMVKWQK